MCVRIACVCVCDGALLYYICVLLCSGMEWGGLVSCDGGAPCVCACAIAFLCVWMVDVGLRAGVNSRSRVRVDAQNRSLRASCCSHVLRVRYARCISSQGRVSDL